MLIAVVISGYFQDALVWLFSLLPIFQVGTVPSGLPTFSVFTVLYLLWNRYIWRWPLFQRFTVPPDLRGEWFGNLESSFNSTDGQTQYPDGGTDEVNNNLPRMKIKQTWTHIAVTIYFEDSTSTSTTAAFLQQLTDPVLRITYQNQPNGSTSNDMVIHEGTNDLKLQVCDEMRVLSGKYYTDEHRNNHGEVYFTQKIE